MHQEIRLHGHLYDTLEFFATAVGREASLRHFYATSGETLRLFSPGSECLLERGGVVHRGNGGAFCEYMFGVDQPLADLAKGDVRNRLVLFGATSREDGSLLFTDATEGRQSYERIFFEGNAVCNYFFFLTGSVCGALCEQQEEILRLLGKFLKRSPLVGARDDTGLADEMAGLLGHKSFLCVVKLIHKKHQRYQDAFQQGYFRRKVISDRDFAALQELAEELGIDDYQQERIRIDVMYKHPDNRRIVDEYKSILIEGHRKGGIGRLENARLTRLKTLSVRNKIPAALFFPLDEVLKHDQLIDLEEQHYLAETRQILEGIFLQERQIDARIDREDMLKLLQAKRRASENRDHTFEQILLETGKACDEKIRDGADMALLENFSSIVTYFDRYETTSSVINQLAFMDDVRFSEEKVRSLLGNKKAFESLSPGLFEELFFSCILGNKYLGRFGRKKIRCLQQGLEQIEGGCLTVQGLLDQLDGVDREAALFSLLQGHVKERIQHFYSRYNSPAEQESLLAEVAEELHHKGLVREQIPKTLFREVVVNIKKEAVYLHTLLPPIIANRDIALREDFLENSGLDRFYVEELEREYFELNNLDLDELYQIRKGLSA